MGQEEREVVERLRKSKKAAEVAAMNPTERAKFLGRERGKTWARAFASATELERLGSFKNSYSPDQWRQNFIIHHAKIDPSGTGHCALSVFGIIKDNTLNEPDAVDQFWEVAGLSPEEAREGYAIQGFVEGAVEVWDDVAPQL